MELTAISVYEKSLIMMSICIKINNVFGKKNVCKKVYHCPCLMMFVDEMENLIINDLDGILGFLKEIKKNEVLSKIDLLIF